ncbi:MAG: hypothetical protein PW843_04835 [Azospirillaceae bacterium]|nr:hypothetical protein [Azospirillaceae bacterium]
MAKSQSHLEALHATARHKADAAKARAQPDHSAEKPKDVILAACAQIGERLASKGFVFLKSGPTLKRTDDDLTFTIQFQSDHNNVAGKRAAVWIHAMVLSRKLAEWDKRHPKPWNHDPRPSGPTIVAGGQIGNLTSPPGWMEWNFADAVTRQDVIDDAVTSIETLALSFFALFGDPAGNMADIAARQLVSLKPLEYAMATLGREAAEAVGRSYLMRHPQLTASFSQALIEFQQGASLPTALGHMARDLATLAFIHDLDLTGQD